jgi:SAM-dependent methyltransferase
MDAPADLPPSPWVTRWAILMRPGGEVLDLACGAGRHSRHLAKLGFEVTAVDRNPAFFADPPPGVTIAGADLEGGPWPFAGRRFDAIVVTNYLHRPLLPVLVESLAPGGVLVYETFARGNERFGKPSNPAFLLAPGELLEAVRGRLRVIAYEDLIVDSPRAAAVQRLCARREDAAGCVAVDREGECGKIADS